jgi:hypothetical protein
MLSMDLRLVTGYRIQRFIFYKLCGLIPAQANNGAGLIPSGGENPVRIVTYLAALISRPVKLE